MEAVYRILHLQKDPPMTRFVASQLGTSHYFNISKAKKYLGYTPIISLKEGVDILVKYY